jgi:ATP sulfurylase
VKRILAYSLLLFLLVACGRDSPPPGILSEDQLVNVMIDIQLTEGIVSSLPIAYDSSQQLYQLMERDVFEKHSLPDSVVTNSMLYYLQDAEKMNRIYSRIIDSLSVRSSIPRDSLDHI